MWSAFVWEHLIVTLVFICTVVYYSERITALGPIEGKHFSHLSSALFYT